MADAPETEPNEAAPEEEAPKSGGLGKFKIIGAVLGIVLIECVLAYIFLPASAETKTLAEEIPTEEENQGEIPGIPIGQLKDLEDSVEFAMGDRFAVVDFRPSDNVTRTIDVSFFVTVSGEDLEDVKAKYAQFEHRIREEIYVILRSSEVDDLTDPALSLICRKILEKVNRTLGKPYVKDVIFDNYAFSEM